MARPATRKVNLKDGFYVEVYVKTSGSNVKLRRETEEEALRLFKQYEQFNNAKYLGKCEKGKFLNKKKK